MSINVEIQADYPGTWPPQRRYGATAMGEAMPPPPQQQAMKARYPRGAVYPGSQIFAPPPSSPPARGILIPPSNGPQITWAFDQTMALMRVSDCLKYFDCGKSKFYAWLNPKSKYHAPGFPRPIYLNGGRVPYWRRADLIAWVDMQSCLNGPFTTGMVTGLI